MSEISKMETDGKFIGNEEFKAGLLLSTIDKFYKDMGYREAKSLWTKLALDSIEKYHTQLPPKRFFHWKIEKNILQKIKENVIKWANTNIYIVSNIFYFTIICSFIFLILSILIR